VARRVSGSISRVCSASSTHRGHCKQRLGLLRGCRP
jgi:hypothetical protein